MSDHTSSVSRPASPIPVLDQPRTAHQYRFSWDPAAPRRAGPGSVSGTTEGGPGDYVIPRPPAELLNSTTDVLPLGALPAAWSSSKHGFHAISTVLNNPHKRQAPPKAHSSLPPIVPAEIPRVRKKDFDSYLRAVDPEWARFETNLRTEHENAAQMDSDHPAHELLDADASQDVYTSSRNLPPLDSVPSVFFDRNFNLGDPTTFDCIIEQPPDSEGSVDPSSLSHSLPLLEKFSHYADTVEQHLVQEISLRASSFFAALTNLRDLQSESEQCLHRIGKLRALLKDVDDKSAKKGLQIVQKELKLRNLGVVRETLDNINGVVKLTSDAKTFVSVGQWNEGMGVIGELETLWSAKSDPPLPTETQGLILRSLDHSSALTNIPRNSASEDDTPLTRPLLPLSSLRAFAALPSHLRDLTWEIASSLSSDVVHILRLDLVERMNRINEFVQRPPDGADVNQQLADRLRPLLHGLVRTMGLKGFALSWRDIVMEEVSAVVQNSLLSLNEPDAHIKGPELGVSVSKHLQSMPHANFMPLMREMYRKLLNCVEGLQSQNMLIMEMISAIRSPNDPPDVSSLQEDFTDIQSSAAESANTRAAAVIAARSDQHAQLDLPEFIFFFGEGWNFVVRCEVICRRMIIGLRGVIVTQAKAFLQNFHHLRITEAAKLVEDEQWSPSEVGIEIQSTVGVLIDSAVRDPPTLVIDVSVADPSTTENGSASDVQPPQSPPPSSPTKLKSSKYLRIEDRQYFTVSATTSVLRLLLDYVKVVVNLTMLTTDTMSKVIEFLKAFNSRTCQVVLGAGAMRSAGLKNITARHLALASQSLSIMIGLVPYVRETFRRHLSPTQAVMLVEFDKLKRDFQEHQNEIHAKLIAIMGDRLTIHIQSFQNIQWDVPKVGDGVNDYMELLVKETLTLHRVLSRYLAVSVVEYVMTQVYATINHRLSEEFARVELLDQSMKDRLLADATYLHQKLSTLKNVGVPGSMLETVVTQRSLVQKPPQSPPTVPFKTTPLTANQRFRERLVNSMRTPSSLIEKAFPISVPGPVQVLSPVQQPPPGGSDMEKKEIPSTPNPENGKVPHAELISNAKKNLEESVLPSATTAPLEASSQSVTDNGSDEPNALHPLPEDDGKAVAEGSDTRGKAIDDAAIEV